MRQLGVKAAAALVFLSVLPAGCRHVDSYNGIKEALSAPTYTTTPQKYQCGPVDYGIYWFGKDNVAQKFVKGTSNPFYDPAKKTVIYVHGWQMQSYLTQRRETFVFKDPTTQPLQERQTANAWIDAGWNVGIFYWTQFADDDDLFKAERKIWFVPSEGLTWRQCDGTPSTAGVPSDATAADLFFGSYKEALADYTGDDIRLVGHSLGNQMVTRLTGMVADAVEANSLDAKLMPKRVALVDPFWSNGPAGDFYYPGAKCRDVIAKTMAAGVAYEMYKASNILTLGWLKNGADLNLLLDGMIGETRWDLGFIKDSSFAGSFQEKLVAGQTARHIAAPRLYFWGFSRKEPPGCTYPVKPCDSVARSAAASNAQIADMMHRAVIWQQTEGGATPDAADDAYVQVFGE